MSSLDARGRGGSLSDVLFSPVNRNATSSEEADRLNREFDALARKGYDLAKALAHDVEAQV